MAACRTPLQLQVGLQGLWRRVPSGRRQHLCSLLAGTATTSQGSRCCLRCTRSTVHLLVLMSPCDITIEPDSALVPGCCFGHCHQVLQELSEILGCATLQATTCLRLPSSCCPRSSPATSAPLRQQRLPFPSPPAPASLRALWEGPLAALLLLSVSLQLHLMHPQCQLPHVPDWLDRAQQMVLCLGHEWLRNAHPGCDCKDRKLASPVW